MPKLSASCLELLLLGLVVGSISVSVTLLNEYEPDFEISLTCPHLLPGHCCTAPQTIFRSYSAHVVTFQGLQAFDIAAIWRSTALTVASPTPNGCSGEVWRSKTGPGTWSWAMWEETLRSDSLVPATGASYIELPRRLPPDAQTSSWLSGEGIFGLVWSANFPQALSSETGDADVEYLHRGDGSWFSTPTASRVLGYNSGINPKSRLRRDIRAQRRGTVYAGSPRRRVYPSSIVVNGTTYSDNAAEGQKYRDMTGNVLNLTQLGEVIHHRYHSNWGT